MSVGFAVLAIGLRLLIRIVHGSSTMSNSRAKLMESCGVVREECEPGGISGTQLLRCQFLYLCTSTASKTEYQFGEDRGRC
jgi:hypothetical protein